MGRTNKARLAVCSKVIVKRECLGFVFFSRLDDYNQALLLGGRVTVIACYSRFVCPTSWRHVRAALFDFRGEKRGGSVPSVLELPVSTGHTSSIRKVDGLHGIKGKYTLLSSSVTTALVKRWLRIWFKHRLHFSTNYVCSEGKFRTVFRMKWFSLIDKKLVDWCLGGVKFIGAGGWRFRVQW